MIRKTAYKIFITVTFLGLLLSTATAFAKENYPMYTVKSGDTLWIIAAKFYTSISEISAANNLKSDTLTVGQKLIVPQTNPYLLTAGDTPYLIAKRFNIPLKDFLSVNYITDVNSLYPGQALKIPGYMAYKVWPGDTLYLLSIQFGAEIDQLIKLNGLKSSELVVGQRLYIPISSKTTGLQQVPKVNESPAIQWNIPSGAALYYVQEKDTLWAIAQKFKTSMDAIKKTNNLKMDLIFPGDPLIVPQNSTQPIYGIKAPSVPAKTGFGELLDWKYARWIFNAGSTATIQDLKTGQKFQAYRIGGSNHADCEPLTAQDTQIMKGLFGNSWTWLTRPVLIRYNGRVLAASMAGQPHAWDTLPNNNFNGMFDLHFLNSRTHNTNSIDTNHKASVQKAAGN